MKIEKLIASFDLCLNVLTNMNSNYKDFLKKINKFNFLMTNQGKLDLSFS